MNEGNKVNFMATFDVDEGRATLSSHFSWRTTTRRLTPSTTLGCCRSAAGGGVIKES